jgi:putative spermidine/putrescine transport system permease protein
VTRAARLVWRTLGGLFACAFFLFMLSPIVIMIAASFSPTGAIKFPPPGLTLKWYGAVFQRTDYVQAFLNSLGLALGASFLALVVALPVAHAVVNYRFPGRNFIDALMMSPLILPQLAFSIGALMYYTAVGIVRNLLTLALLHAIVCTPYLIRLIAASMYGFDQNLERAAMNLGASRVRAFWRVKLPLIRPGIIAGLIFSFIISFDNVVVSVLLLPAGTTTLPVMLFQEASERGLATLLAAVCSILVTLMLAVVLLLERLYGLRRLLVVTAR